MKSIGSVIDKVNQESLKTTFMEACSNKDFKDFVYSLGINEETLMKYTSSLEDSFLEYENCRNCKGLSCCSNQMKGYRYTPEEDGRQILFSYIACPQYNAYIKMIKLVFLLLSILKNLWRGMQKKKREKDYI